MDSNNTPVVSIVLPTYNRVELLTKAVNSVIEQSYNDWELIIVDDGSSDGTAERMKVMQENDNRINYLRISKINNSGIYQYLNIGLEKAKGKYIARIDDDDFWCYKDKLKCQVDFLDKNPEYDIVGGGVVLIDKDGNEMFKYFKKERDETIRDYALYCNPFTHATVMFRKDKALKLGGYRKLNHVEDMDLWLRMGMHGKMYNFQIYFIKYMSAGQNKSFTHQTRNSKTVLEVIKTHRKNYPHFYKAYLLNYMQYLYSFIPITFKKPIQSFLYYFKRKYF